MDTSDMTLKEKCKFYQKQRDYVLDTNNFILVHIDGRSFSKMVKNKFEKPFSVNFVNMMDTTASYLCEKIQGVQLAYVQSDEITLLLNKKTPESEIFFNGRLCKMQSIISSLATGKFNQLMTLWYLKNQVTEYNTLDLISNMPLYQFDCKVWEVPSYDEVIAWFLFRNIDCIRNSKQQTAQTYISHNILKNKTADDQIKYLYEKEGIDWNKFDDNVKYGRLITKEYVECTRLENDKTINFTRGKWVIKNGFDLTLSENRDKFKTFINILS